MECSSDDWEYSVSDCKSVSGGSDIREVSYSWKAGRICASGVHPLDTTIECEYVHSTSGAAVTAMFVLAGVLMAWCVHLLIQTWYKRNEKKMYSAKPHLVGVLLVGSITLLITVFLTKYVNDIGDVEMSQCSGFREYHYLWSIIFLCYKGLVAVALLFKTYEMWRRRKQLDSHKEFNEPTHMFGVASLLCALIAIMGGVLWRRVGGDALTRYLITSVSIIFITFAVVVGLVFWKLRKIRGTKQLSELLFGRARAEGRKGLIPVGPGSTSKRPTLKEESLVPGRLSSAGQASVRSDMGSSNRLSRQTAKGDAADVLFDEILKGTGSDSIGYDELHRYVKDAHASKEEARSLHCHPSTRTLCFLHPPLPRRLAGRPSKSCFRTFTAKLKSPG